jgi:hypothetical protein
MHVIRAGAPFLLVFSIHVVTLWLLLSTARLKAFSRYPSSQAAWLQLARVAPLCKRRLMPPTHSQLVVLSPSPLFSSALSFFPASPASFLLLLQQFFPRYPLFAG